MVTMWHLSSSKSARGTLFEENWTYFVFFFFGQKYDRFFFVGDVNLEETDLSFQTFSLIMMQKLIKSKTCFKNPLNPRCIDRFITHFSSQNNRTLSCGLSDFRKTFLTSQLSSQCF